MKKVIHYRPSGQSTFCRCSGSLDAETAFTDVMAGRATTDIRGVTCPLCLHAVAGSMIRKGVPIRFTAVGRSFYEKFIPVPKPRDGEASIQNGGAA
jgi:hypothetical protein